MNAWLRSVCRNKRFGLMTRVVKRKFFFLITGSDLLFNKLDEIEHEFISLIISERNGFNVIAISSVIRCCRWSGCIWLRVTVSESHLWMRRLCSLRWVRCSGWVWETDQLSWGYIVKQLSAYGGCLGSQRRWKTWKPAIRHSRTGRTRGTETSKYPKEKKSTEIPSVAASERGPALKLDNW